nr:MAG TPA: hypothetical protein [Caudoviricetes sp.]
MLKRASFLLVGLCIFEDTEIDLTKDTVAISDSLIPIFLSCN